MTSHGLVSASMRRNRPRAALILLLALILQAASAAAPPECSGPQESKGHNHVSRVSESHVPSLIVSRTSQSTETEAGPCCGPLAPPEPDEHETESCAMAMHCVVSIAMPAEPSLAVDPVAESGAPSDQCTRPDAVVLPHPGPPPRA